MGSISQKRQKATVQVQNRYRTSAGVNSVLSQLEAVGCPRPISRRSHAFRAQSRMTISGHVQHLGCFFDGEAASGPDGEAWEFTLRTLCCSTMLSMFRIRRCWCTSQETAGFTW